MPSACFTPSGDFLTTHCICPVLLSFRLGNCLTPSFFFYDSLPHTTIDCVSLTHAAFTFRFWQHTHLDTRSENSWSHPWQLLWWWTTLTDSWDDLTLWIFLHRALWCCFPHRRLLRAFQSFKLNYFIFICWYDLFKYSWYLALL